MFAPLGVYVALRGVGYRGAFLAGLVASATIEALQVWVPGRSATLGDIVWNAVGALSGVALLRLFQYRSEHRAADRGIWAAAAFALWVLLAGVSATPTGTDSQYFGMWTPELEYMPQYGGTVRAATLNEEPIPRGGPLPLSSEIPAALQGTWSLQATVTLGPRPVALAPIVAIYDQDKREIALLGAHEGDLVWRERLLSDRLKLDKPDLRFRGALNPFDEGTDIGLSVRREGRLRCLAVEGVEQCSPYTRVERSWAFLRWFVAPPATRAFLDILWLCLLLLPVGFFSTTRLEAVLATSAAMGAVAVVVLSTSTGGPHPFALLGGLAGVAAGGWIGQATTRRQDDSSAPLSRMR